MVQTRRQSYQNSCVFDRFLRSLVFHIAQFVEGFNDSKVGNNTEKGAQVLPPSNCPERTNCPLGKAKRLQKTRTSIHQKYVQGLTYPGERIVQDDFHLQKKEEKKARWILTRCPEHASEGTESSFLKGVTQNVGTLWLESIMQCYHWRPNVVILSRDPKRASQSGVGERQGPGADTFSNRFSESHNTPPPPPPFSSQVTVDILPEKSTLTTSHYMKTVISKVMLSARDKRSTVSQSDIPSCFMITPVFTKPRSLCLT